MTSGAIVTERSVLQIVTVVKVKTLLSVVGGIKSMSAGTPFQTRNKPWSIWTLTYLVKTVADSQDS